MNYIEKMCKLSNQVYLSLQDELSKEIFISRMLYSLTKDEKYIDNLVRCAYPVWKLRTWAREKAEENKRLFIYGAGHNGVWAYDMTKEEIRWDCFIDINKSESIVNGINVISLQELEKVKDTAAVMISIEKGYVEVEEILKSIGLESENIFSWGRILWKPVQQYFEDFLPHYEEEVFVDAGVYDGQSTLDFIAWANNDYHKVLMFEPSIDYKNRFYGDKIAGLKECYWIEKGLSSSEGSLKFYECKDTALSISDELSGLDTSFEGGRWVEVLVTSLDMYIDEKITFIKMDIEGSEAEALRGSEQVIKKYKPKLAISLYHKLEDVWEIPQLLLEYNPEYKLYIRQYRMDLLETVLYAV